MRTRALLREGAARSCHAADLVGEFWTGKPGPAIVAEGQDGEVIGETETAVCDGHFGRLRWKRTMIANNWKQRENERCPHLGLKEEQTRRYKWPGWPVSYISHD